jgi:ketosteroid isomerase-like protein
MSAQENTSIVKQTYEAFKSGDIEGLLKHYSDNIVWEIYGPPTIPTAGTRRGRTELAQFFAMVNEVMDSKQFDVNEFIAQDDQVAVVGAYTWEVKATGRTVTSNFTHIVTLSNGKITRFREYTDTAAFVAAFSGKSKTAP